MPLQQQKGRIWEMVVSLAAGRDSWTVKLEGLERMEKQQQQQKNSRQQTGNEKELY